jgi:hypothetical protein
MRTKALLALALSGGGISLAFGQTVSQNIVGYINVDIKPGLNLIANQLDNKNGNKVKDLLPTVPDGTTLYFWNNATGSFVDDSFFAPDWDKPDLVLAPGSGCFVDNPGTATKFLFVGEVMLGAQSVNLPAGLQIISSVPPVVLVASELTPTGAATFPAGDGDTIYQWTGTGYRDNSYFGEWDHPDYTIAVGEAFFYSNSGAAKTWTRTFTVQ